MSATAVPLCPSCASPAAAWQIDSPVRAHDRVMVDPAGIRLLGLHAPAEGLEPVDRPVIACGACSAPAEDVALRDSILTAATAASRGAAPRFDA
jgi:hypothetical protein